MANNEESVGEIINPSWLFRCRPIDFSEYRHSICPGIFWLPGVSGLLFIHSACFYVFFALWSRRGWDTNQLRLLAPVGLVWVVLGGADIRFRLQRPSRQQRAGFDNAALNWFGLVFTILFYVVGVPAAAILLVWWIW